MQPDSNKIFTPQWHSFLEHREVVAYIRRKRKRQLISSILGAYIAFVGIFSYLFFTQSERITYAREPAEVVGAIMLLDNKDVYSYKDSIAIKLTLKNKSELELAKNIKISFYSTNDIVSIQKVSLFGVKDSLINPGVNNQVKLSNLLTSERSEYVVEGKIANVYFRDVNLLPILEYETLGVQKSIKLNSINLITG